MLLAGDELNNSQQGNNNTYCQNNALGWINWENADDSLIEFVGKLSDLRKKYNAISRAEFLTGKLNDHGNSDVSWFNINGSPMQAEHWDDVNNKSLAVKFAAINKNESPVLVLINASHVTVDALLPGCDTHGWTLLIHSDKSEASTISNTESTAQITLPARSIYVFEGQKLA